MTALPYSGRRKTRCWAFQSKKNGSYRWEGKMRESEQETVIVALGSFCRSSWPLPPSRHPVNAPAGGFLLSLVRKAARTYQEKKEFPALDEWQLIRMMKNETPGEPEADYHHAKMFVRMAYQEIKKEMEAGEISGLPPDDNKIATITKNIELKVKPALVDVDRKIVFEIRSHTLRTPLQTEMYTQYMHIVGLSFAYPAPPWRIILVGFNRRTGALQKLWWNKQSQRTPEFLKARDIFLKKLQDYVHGDE